MYRIVFLGSGELARGVLMGLLDSEHNIVGVLPWEKTHSTGWMPRIKRIFMPDNIAVIRQNCLHLLNSGRANTKAFIDEVAALKPDILLVASWGEIIKPEVLALARVASVNVHPSLLPLHRGSNPISSVLCAGEKQTGVTYHYLNAKVDAGDILLQSSLNIGMTETSDSLSRKIGFLARQTVSEALNNIQRHDFVAQPQDESRAQYVARLGSAEVALDWNRSAVELHNKVRGHNPWRRVYTLHAQTKLYVQATEVISLHKASLRPGEVLHTSGSQMVVSTGDPRKALLLKQISLNGKLGNIRAKIYVANSVKAGDCLNSAMGDADRNDRFLAGHCVDLHE